MTTKRSFFNPFVMKSVVMAGFLLFAVSAVHAQFNDWDADEDAKISKTEFSDGIFSDGKYDSGLFDGDDYDDNKFYETSYGWWDRNKDQQLDESEWDFGYSNSYGDYLDNDFDAYDADQNGYLDYDEYNNSVSETDYFSDWDTNKDDVLDNDEYSSGLFDTWDLNGDSYVDENEYGDFND